MRPRSDPASGRRGSPTAWAAKPRFAPQPRRTLLPRCAFLLGATLAVAPVLAVAPSPALAPAAATTGPSTSDPSPSTSATAREITPTRVEDGLQVSVDAITPAVVAPGDAVDLEVTLTNVSAAPIEDVSLSAHLQASVPNSRTALLSWTRERLGWQAAPAATLESLAALEAGDSVTRTVHIPADALPVVDAASWGPRGLEIAARDRSGDASGSLRTWLVMAPPEAPTPLPFTTVVPLVATSAELENALDEDDPSAAVRSIALPRIERTASALAGRATTFAVDPLLLEPVDPSQQQQEQQEALEPQAAEDANAAAAPAAVDGGQGTNQEPNQDTVQTPQPGPEPGTQSGTQPAAETGTEPAPDPVSEGTLREILTGGVPTPLLLASGDADLAALAHADRADLVLGALEDARDRAHAAEVPARSDVLLPLAGPVDSATVTAARSAGLTSIVGPAGVAALPDSPSWTPSARVTVPTDAGADTPAVLGDVDLTRIVTGTLPTGPDAAGSGRLDPIEARQLALALTAVIQRERPNDPRAVAVVLDRTALEDADAEASAALTVDALAHAPWLTPSPLATAADAAPAELTTLPLPERETVKTELEPRTIASLTRLLERTRQLAAATADPEAVLAGPTERLHMVLSGAWRDAPRVRERQVRSLSETLAAAPQQVHIAPSSTINMLATSAELPVRVTNDLPVAIRATVRLDPPDTRLRAEKPVTVEIPANGEATALVPVQARGSGNFELRASLVSESGVELGRPALIDVRLRADWEGRGAVLGGVVLAAVVLIGIVRTARRSRRTRTDDAASPEAEADHGAAEPSTGQSN